MCSHLKHPVTMCQETGCVSWSAMEASLDCPSVPHAKHTCACKLFGHVQRNTVQYNSIIKLIRGSDDGLVVAAIFFIRFKAASYS